MFKFFKDNIILIFVLSCILAVSTQADGNEIYINQSGANVEVTIVQDGQNNRISTKSTAASPATAHGKNQTYNFETFTKNQIQRRDLDKLIIESKQPDFLIVKNLSEF